MSSKEPHFFRAQREFTRYLRDPHNSEPPAGITQDRLAIYSHAVRSNAGTFLSDNFPRVQEILSKPVWDAMVQDYFSRHSSHTPLFVDLPNEFIAYLDETRDVPNDPPFLLEVAHFDLLENLVSTDETVISDTDVAEDGDLMSEVPIINPTAQLVRYTFPVHQIDAAYEAEDVPDSPTFIVAFRARNHRFGYMDLNAPSARAVELLLSLSGLTGEAIMQQIARELNQADASNLLDAGRLMLERFREQDIILGTKK